MDNFKKKTITDKFKIGDIIFVKKIKNDWKINNILR